jgi:putative ABC transport system ATP-binding protein
MAPPALAVEDLELAFSDLPVLTAATFRVERGEVVSLQGPSGSGKSSLLRCLCGLFAPRRGAVLVEGTPAYDLGPVERDRLRSERFGMVFQFGELLDELTLAENVALPLRLQRVPWKAARAEATRRMESLQIDHLADRLPADVSGGQMQRAAIARALVHAPAVVLADEPTGALDDDTADVVFALLLEQARTAGAAVIVATHDQDRAAQADRQMLIEDGTVAVVG